MLNSTPVAQSGSRLGRQHKVEMVCTRTELARNGQQPSDGWRYNYPNLGLARRRLIRDTGELAGGIENLHGDQNGVVAVLLFTGLSSDFFHDFSRVHNFD